MTGTKMQTRIYIADVHCLNEKKLFAKYYAAVNKERRAKVDRMRFQKDKILSLGVEILLQRACKDFGIEYNDASIAENEYGKPYFKDIDLAFNLSHSGERAMCIMSEELVGCDVEEIDTPDLQILSFFSAEERAQILALKNDDSLADYFYRLWTLKESFVKCAGAGLEIDLTDFTVRIHSDYVELKQSITKDVYFIGECHLNDNYRYAWCRRKSGGETEIKPLINFYSLL